VNELMLCNVSVQNLHLREAIPLAARAGFEVMSIVARPHRKSGMTNAEIGALLAAHGMRVQEVEAAFDWLVPFDQAGTDRFRPDYDTEELLDIAAELGARTLVGIHFGPPRALEAAIDAFGRFCDRAAERGLDAALEFAPIATITDLASAWDIVSGAGRRNGGLLVDLWHHRRSGGEDELLDRIPADRILSVQVSDGARQPEGTLDEDVQRRRLPGDGELGVPAFVRRLVDHGVRCPIGVEAFDAAALRADPEARLRALHESLRRVTDDRS
jgi:sugar phosphate isomerase/epimerase